MLLMSVQSANSLPEGSYRGGRKKEPPPPNMTPEQRQLWEMERDKKDKHNDSTLLLVSQHRSLLLLLLQNLYSAQIQASSSQRRWSIARWRTWLAGVGKEVSFETAFERANGW